MSKPSANAQLVPAILDEVAKGNGAPFWDACHDDLVWRAIGTGSWSGEFAGKQTVVDEIFRPLNRALAARTCELAEQPAHGTRPGPSTRYGQAHSGVTGASAGVALSGFRARKPDPAKPPRAIRAAPAGARSEKEPAKMSGKEKGARLEEEMASPGG